MKWFRCYNGMATDTNWRMVAADTGLPVHAVLAVWTMMLCHASTTDPRGTLAGWMDKRAAANLDLKPADITAIRDAMQGVTLNGERLIAWDQEQYESDNSTTRVREYRKRARERSNVDTGPLRDVGETVDHVPETLHAADETFPPLRATDNRYQNKEPPLRGDKARTHMSGDSPEFEAFWNAFPNKVGKAHARKAFPAALRKASLNDIIEAVGRYERRLAFPNAPSPCNPATWLNQERWTDKPMEMNHGQRDGPSQQGNQRRGAAALAAWADEELEVGADRGHRDSRYDLWHPADGRTLEGTCERLSEYPPRGQGPVGNA